MSNRIPVPCNKIVLRAIIVLGVFCFCGFAVNANAAVSDVVAIAAGGPAESNASGGDASFVADEYFNGGGDNTHTSHAISLTQPGANAAPMGVYQYGRAGATTYTIPNLTAGSSYTVLLHFSENYFTAAGKREFDVAINNTAVLTNFDIYKTVGAEYAALVESFTATANSSGDIVIALTDGAANQPLIMGIEIRSSSSPTCSAVTPAPTALAVTATTSSSVSLSWTAPTPPANCTVSSYVVDDGTSTPPTTVAASGVTGTTYTVTGLAASTTYYFSVAAVDAYGTSAASTIISDKTSAASCAAVTAAPTAPTVTATTSSSISLSWTAPTPPANCTVGSYVVYDGTSSPPTAVAASGVTSTTYTVTGLAASTKYYLAVAAVDAYGTSAASAPVSDTTSAASNQTEIVAIDSGGGPVSNANGGDASFVADEFYSGGGTSTSTSPVTVTGITNAAPMNVYLTQRDGTFNYTIPGLAAGAQYTVLLHFAETYFSAAGKRVFNVAINGATVLSDLDIFAQVGENVALVESFTATASSSGQIVVSFTNGTANQPTVAGLEIRGVPSACTLLPSAAPTGLTALASSPSIIGLNWTPAVAPPNCSITYNLYASTTSGFTPGAGNLIASNLTGTSYSNSGLHPSTTYYYAIETVDSVGASAPSTEASDTTHSATSCIAIPSVAPTNFTATNASSSAIALSWTPIDAPEYCADVTYSIYGSSTSGFVPALTNQIASNLTSTEFYNTSLPPSSTYYYVIQAVDEDGASTVYSQQASAETLTAPSVLTATAVSPNEVDLVFPESTLAAPVTYLIYRSTSSTFTPAASNEIGTTKSNAFQDVVAAASTTYYYQVVASSPSGNAAPTGPVSATTLAIGSSTPFWDASGIPATPSGYVMTYKILNRTNGRYPDDQVTWSTTINGVVTTNTIAAQPTIAIPAGASGRMSFYLGPEGLSSPYVDFIEYTIGDTFFNGDTTRVDAFAVKLAFNLTCGDGTNIAVGENAATFAEDRSATFQRFSNAVPQPFPVLAQLKAPYSIPNPGVLFNAGGEYENYYTDYINEVWATNPLSAVPMPGDNASGLGNYPGLSAAIYRHIAGPNTFNSSGAVVSDAIWGNPNLFYPEAPADYYAWFWHQNAINYQQYGFPYDDSGGYSSDVSCSSPQTLVVAVGW
jgi:fibronectin type 3 domain-containing protein